MDNLDWRAPKLPALSISAVARETGLSCELLRKWEKRYGFPTPQRNANGERIYSLDQVEQLLAAKRLVDAGSRPGEVLRLGSAELRRRALEAAAPSAGSAGAPQQFLGLLRDRRLPALRERLREEWLREGLGSFVRRTVAPLTGFIGEEWCRGRLEIFETQLCTQAIADVLRSAMAELSSVGGSPRVLLTTLPGERHELGFLMAGSVLVDEGADCILLGTEMPMDQIGKALEAQQADIVALSFSSHLPTRRVVRSLRELRLVLGDGPEIWAGGAGVRPSRSLLGLHGVRLMPSLDDAVDAVAQWRAPGEQD